MVVRYLSSIIDFKLNTLMDMQRLWTTDAAGYSSKSTIFLFIFSMISLSASGGIHVWTKLLHRVLISNEAKDEFNDSRCEVQQRITVKSTFVMEKLISCRRWNTSLGNSVFRCTCSISVTTPRLVHDSSGAVTRMFLVDVIFGLFDDTLGVD